MQTRRPLVPEDITDRPAHALAIAACAHLLAFRGKTDTTAILKERWPHERAVEVLLRAESNPATTFTPGWASNIARNAVADFISILSPQSAGAQLLALGMQLQFPDGVFSIAVPSMVATASGAGFVGEGAPVPVRQGEISGAVLQRYRLLSTCAFTNEIADHSTPNIEAFMRAALAETTGPALDGAMLSASPGSETVSPGLLFGITPLSVSTGTTSLTEALLEDVSDLVAAVANVAGSGPIILIAAPKQASRLKLFMRDADVYTILASVALTPGMVVCVAGNALASAISPIARFDVGDQMALHMEDADPLDISAGTTLASPVVSMWQAHSTALKMSLEIAWALRNAGGIAFKSPVTW